MLAGNAEHKIITPEKYDMQIQVDGKLNEEIWNRIDSVDDFFIDSQSSNLILSKKTEVKIFYNDDYFNFGIILYDNPENIVYKKGLNDDFENTFYEKSDYFIIEFDSFHDHKTGFGFAVNSAGLKADYSISDDTYYDDDWNGLWEASTSINDNCWIIEYQIPISNLKFSNSKNMTMGINFIRYFYNEDKYASWVNRNNSDNEKIISYFGHLKNINLKFDKVILIRPSISTNRFKYDDYFYKEYDIDLDGNIVGLKDWAYNYDINNYTNIALDINYLFNANKSLYITLNPNFDNLNKDPSEINNTAFETYYIDNRPFFVDNSTFFSTPIEVFYSRRIGKENVEYKDNINGVEQYYLLNAKLLGAFNFLGRNNHFSYGIMGAQTKIQDKTFDDLSYYDNKIHYSVVRFKKNVFQKKSYIGFLNTNYNFRDDFSHVYSLDGLFNISDNLEFYYQIIESIQSKQSGYAKSYEINYKSRTLKNEKLSNSPFYIESWIKWDSFDKNFNIDKVGYLYRNNLKDSHLGISLNMIEGDDFITDFSFILQHMYAKNLFDVRLKNIISSEFNLQFINNWMVNFGVSKSESSYLDRLYNDYFYDDRYTGITRNIKIPGERNYFIKIETNKRKKVSFSLMFDYFNNHLKDDGQWYSINTSIAPNDWFEFNITYDELSYYRTFHFLKIKILGDSGDTDNEISDRSFIDRDDQEYQFLFVNSRNKEKVFTIKALTHINEKMSIQFFCQHFTYINSWLDNYYEFSNETEDFSYPQEVDYNPNQDIGYDELLYSAKYSSLKMNLILSWEFRKNNVLSLGYNLNKDINGLIFNKAKDLLEFNTSISNNNLLNPEVWYDNSYFVRYDFILEI